MTDEMRSRLVDLEQAVDKLRRKVTTLVDRSAQVSFQSPAKLTGRQEFSSYISQDLGAIEEEQEQFKKRIPNVLVDRSESPCVRTVSGRSSASLERHSHYFAQKEKEDLVSAFRRSLRNQDQNTSFTSMQPSSKM
jgi:hypothetical protein